MAQRVKGLSAMQETRVRSLGQEDPLEKEMATHSRTIAWKIPWMEEPGRLQSMGSQRVGHDWVTSLYHFIWYSICSKPSLKFIFLFLSIVCSFLQMSTIPLTKAHFDYPLTCWWAFGCFWSLSNTRKSFLNVTIVHLWRGMHVFLTHE